MVTSVTNFGRSGLYDWLVQRVSAVILAVYTIFLVGFIVCTPDLGYEQWSELFGQLWMRVFSLIALLSIVAHAWIGLWCVLTDYVTTQLMGPSGTALRVVLQLALWVVLVAYMVWGVEILWGFGK